MAAQLTEQRAQREAIQATVRQVSHAAQELHKAACDSVFFTLGQFARSSRPGLLGHLAHRLYN